MFRRRHEYHKEPLHELVSCDKIKLFDGQRTIQDRHVQDLVDFYRQQLQELGTIDLTGTIKFAKLFDCDDLVIIDGQHRFMALRALVNSGSLTKTIEIMTELFIVATEDNIFEEFKNINQSIPVPIHYLQPNELANRVTNLILSHFQKCFSRATCTRRPKISIEKFKDVLVQSKRFGQLDPKLIANEIIHLNNEYYNRGVDFFLDNFAKNNKRERAFIKGNYTKCDPKLGDYMCLGLLVSIEMWINLI